MSELVVIVIDLVVSDLRRVGDRVSCRVGGRVVTVFRSAGCGGTVGAVAAVAGVAAASAFVL